MEATQTQLEEKLANLLKQAAAVASEIQSVEQRGQTPHFDEIEMPAHDVGQQLSRMIQSARARDVAADHDVRADCPDCKRSCRVDAKVRQINSMDGPIELTETVAHCRHCRRSFFPTAGRNGL